MARFTNKRVRKTIFQIPDAIIYIAIVAHALSRLGTGAFAAGTL